MSDVFVELERLTSVAPLGVRFWDPATARGVYDGLRLTNVESGRSAIPTRSGVFVAWNLPGLADAEHGRGDAPYWASPPVHKRLTFEMVDDQRRFHDVRFDAVVPTRGLFEKFCGFNAPPPETLPPSVPLFSLPSRPASPGCAVVRAELLDAVTRQPAAWAVLEVTAPGVGVARGVADRNGRVMVLLAYPEPPGNAPPPVVSRPLSAQTWSVQLSVRYSPGHTTLPLPRATDATPPDLCSVLTQQTATLASAASPGVPIHEDELVFGRELVLNHGQRRTLLLTPPA